MINLLFESKETRDKEFKRMKSEGMKVRKSSTSNQLIHPQYIEDFDGPEKNDTGFGNSSYKTHFSKLYKIVDDYK